MSIKPPAADALGWVVVMGSSCCRWRLRLRARRCKAPAGRRPEGTASECLAWHLSGECGIGNRGAGRCDESGHGSRCGAGAGARVRQSRACFLATFARHRLVRIRLGGARDGTSGSIETQAARRSRVGDGNRTVRRRQGRQEQQAPAPKVAQVAVEPEIEKTDGKSGGGSPRPTTPPRRRPAARRASPSPKRQRPRPPRSRRRATTRKRAPRSRSDRRPERQCPARHDHGADQPGDRQLAEADAHAVKLEFPQANAALAATGVIARRRARRSPTTGAPTPELRLAARRWSRRSRASTHAAVTASLNTAPCPGRRPLVAATLPNFIAATAQLSQASTTSSGRR